MRIKNKLALRVLSAAAVMAMVTSIAAPAFADAYGIAEYKLWSVGDGNISVEGNHVTVTDSTGKLIHEEDDNDKDGITITGTSKENNVTLTDATVTIKDLDIDVSGKDKAALTVKGNGTTNIELNGNNTLTSGDTHAGLEKNDADGTGSLVIKDDTKDGGSLTANGGESGAGSAVVTMKTLPTLKSQAAKLRLLAVRKLPVLAAEQQTAVAVVRTKSKSVVVT